METLQEQVRAGMDCVRTVTALLQRSRAAHPTAGLMEAADYNWWWTVQRPTDEFEQLFWFDADGRPEAAMIATQWGDGIGLDPMVMPDSSPEWVAHVVKRGLEHIDRAGFSGLEVMVDSADETLVAALATHGFVPQAAEALQPDVEAWLDTRTLPEISDLAEGYRLVTRQDLADRPHHFDDHGPDAGLRLQNTPLYRPELDLVVLGPDDHVAARGLFWRDPVTATGLVEPMRTMDDHQQRGLARHILTSGVHRLNDLGTKRVKIVFDPTNAAAKHLYLSVGFRPAKETIVVTRS